MYIFNTVSLFENIDYNFSDSLVNEYNLKLKEVPSISLSFIDCTSDGPDDCAAGGPGSTSCSYTIGPVECSVECGSGWHSCCGASMGCKCRKNDKVPTPD